MNLDEADKVLNSGLPATVARMAAAAKQAMKQERLAEAAEILSGLADLVEAAAVAARRVAKVLSPDGEEGEAAAVLTEFAADAFRQRSHWMTQVLRLREEVQRRLKP